MAHDKLCGPCRVLFDKAEQNTEAIGTIPADEGDPHQGGVTETTGEGREKGEAGTGGRGPAQQPRAG
jgi:hypothetical protein